MIHFPEGYIDIVVHEDNTYPCPLCGKGAVGGITISYTDQHRNFERIKREHQVYGRAAVFVGRICWLCESEFRRRTIPKPKKKPDITYKKFLRNELYPEIKCHFEFPDGLVVDGRLKKAM